MDDTTSRLQTTALLTQAEIPGYLVARGLLAGSTPVTVEPLGGGVSNEVFAVRTPAGDLVVKQALPRLRVADVWDADPARAVREGLALRALHALTPESVPPCIDIDEDRNVVVMPHAPAGWEPWKSRLLAGAADPAVASRLGRLLAIWHQATRTRVPEPLRDRVAFDQLRVDPYYRTVMVRRPDVADQVGRRLDRLLASPQCLVHGDFSPKNVLCGADGLWVIDLEVAHVGDPAFDIAFLLSHLVLKAVHRPTAAAGYGACAEAFTTAYVALTGPGTPWEHVTGHVGCLLLARVVGKSPVEYLDESQRTQVSELGTGLVVHPAATVPDLWTRVGAVTMQ